MRAKGIEPTPKIHAALHFYKIMYYLKTDKQDFKAVREAVVQLQEHFIPGMCFTKVISYLRILVCFSLARAKEGGKDLHLLGVI